MDDLIDKFKEYGMNFSRVSYSTIRNLMVLLTDLMDIINMLEKNNDYLKKIVLNQHDLIKQLKIEIKLLEKEKRELKIRVP